MDCILYWGLGFIIYLIIGRAIVQLKWDYFGFPYFDPDQDIEALFLTIFWPFYVFGFMIKTIALLIVDLIYKIFE